MFTVQLHNGGSEFLIKTIPSIQQGGIRADNLEEVYLAAQHYFGVHGVHQYPGNPAIERCPFCRHIRREP